IQRSMPPTPRASTRPSSAVKRVWARETLPSVPVRSMTTGSPNRVSSTRLSRAELPRLTLTACLGLRFALLSVICRLLLYPKREVHMIRERHAHQVVGGQGIYAAVAVGVVGNGLAGN